MSDWWEVSASEPEIRAKIIKFVGGSAAITKSFGSGVTTTYISTGIVDLVFGTEVSGLTYVGCIGHCFEATTQSALKGYTMVPGAYNATTRTLRINITGDGGAGAPALVDLAALQFLTLQIAFKATGVTG